MMPSVSTQSLEQLYSSLMPLNVQVLSLDWVPLMAALGPNDRSWSCLLKLKGLVFTLVTKLCLLYSYKVLRNLGFQPLSVPNCMYQIHNHCMRSHMNNKNDNLVRNLPNQHVRQTFKSKLWDAAGILSF